MNVSYADIPQSKQTQTNKTIYYRRKADNKVKYVYMHQEDREYILYWFSRLVADFNAKKITNPELFTDSWVDRSNDNLPLSGYSKKRNSVMSFTAGVLSNKFRNPAEDFAYNQIKYIKYIFTFIDYIYNDQKVFELGYNVNTNQDNQSPKKLSFVEV